MIILFCLILQGILSKKMSSCLSLANIFPFQTKVDRLNIQKKNEAIKKYTKYKNGDETFFAHIYF